MKIAAVTLVRDSAKFIVPHLKMYTGVARNIVLFIPQQINGGSSGHSKDRDSSLELIQKFCPDVEIFHTNNDVWGASLFNEALELASDCDKIVMFHADVVISQVMWHKLRRLLDADYEVYLMDMKKCFINYYHDFDHGVRDCLDTEPIAVASNIRFNGIYGTSGKTYLIQDFEAHHFCGWKGIFATKDWLGGHVPSESNIYIHQLQPEGGWLKCPENIKEAFDENSFRPG